MVRRIRLSATALKVPRKRRVTAAWVVAVGLLVSASSAGATIEGMEGKIAFQRPGTGGDWDIWISDARLAQCSDGLNNDVEDTDPDAADGGCANPRDRDERSANEGGSDDAPLFAPEPLTAANSAANETEPAWADPDCSDLTCAGRRPMSTTLVDLEQVLAFASDRPGAGGPRDIYAVFGSGAPTLLVGDPADDGSPSLCCRNTGHFIAFDSNRGGNRDIYAAPLNNPSNSCRLTSDPAPDMEPDWSPDGKHVVFERHSGGETQIWVVDVDVTPSGSCTHGNARLVTPNQPPSFEPSWFEWVNPSDEDGLLRQRIAFRGPEDDPDSNIHFIEQAYAPGAAPASPFADAATLLPNTLVDDPSEDLTPSWSPYGAGLVFASNRSGGYDLYFVDANGEQPATPLPSTSANDLRPAIQPLPVTDDVRGIRICGRACRRRRRHSRAGIQRGVVLNPEAETRGGCTWRGTPGRDVKAGTPGRDVLCGLGGNDTLRGRGGNDLLRGGTGRDKLLGQAGTDRVEGGSGRDSLFGGLGRDSLFGGSGPDLLDGGSDRDRLFGEAGGDRLRARGSGRDRLSGGPGTDTAKVDRRDVVIGVERRRR
jgi:RTX calcium-binding nonapeptide repeat (4 copies)/WD40-like Beta Propeller Repeat